VTFQRLRQSFPTRPASGSERTALQHGEVWLRHLDPLRQDLLAQPALRAEVFSFIPSVLGAIINLIYEKLAIGAYVVRLRRSFSPDRGTSGFNSSSASVRRSRIFASRSRRFARVRRDRSVLHFGAHRLPVRGCPQMGQDVAQAAYVRRQISDRGSGRA
jgi:hypothetical protein